MVITESQRGFNRRNRYLTNIDFISEQAMSPEAVPIIESSEYGAYMIDLEDVISFKESNGYSDLGDAFYTICECNNIDPDSTIFSIDEVSIIANEDSLGNLVTNLMNNGCAVVAKPVSSNLPLCMVGEACMDYGIYYDDWSLLEAWVTDDWDYLCETITSPMTNHWIKKMINDTQNKSLQAKLKQAYQDMITSPMNYSQKEVSGRLQHIVSTSSELQDYRQAHKMSKKQLDQLKAEAKLRDEKREAEKNGLEIREFFDPDQRKKVRIKVPKTERTLADRTIGQVDEKEYANNPEYATALQTGNRNVAVKTNAVDNVDDTSTSSEPKVEEVKKETQSLQQEFSNLKYKDIGSVRRWIAVKLARLRQWAKNIDAEVKAKGDKAGMFAKVKAFIARGIAWLTQKLHNLAAGDKYSLKDDDKFDYDAYKNERNAYEKSDEYKNRK